MFFLSTETAIRSGEMLRTRAYAGPYGWKNVHGGWFYNVDETLTEKNLRHHQVFDMVAFPQKFTYSTLSQYKRNS